MSTCSLQVTGQPAWAFDISLAEVTLPIAGLKRRSPAYPAYVLRNMAPDKVTMILYNWMLHHYPYHVRELLLVRLVGRAPGTSRFVERTFSQLARRTEGSRPLLFSILHVCFANQSQVTQAQSMQANHNPPLKKVTLFYAGMH